MDFDIRQSKKIFRHGILKAEYGLKSVWRRWRISQFPSIVLGPQYKRSRDAIEIDITYACNLRCTNCNRSVTQAPEKVHISLDSIREFVLDSLKVDKAWRKIRVLGGEPTLHPQFMEILDELFQYKSIFPRCRVVVVTNGNGKGVQSVLTRIPAWVEIENTAKQGSIQPHFGAFNMAPADDGAFTAADFSNGCEIMKECGMGLGPGGYYQCAVAAGIDRVIGMGLGRSRLPKDVDDMTDLCQELCRLCGHFKEGHMVPGELRPPLFEEKLSPTWQTIYVDWKAKKDGERRAA